MICLKLLRHWCNVTPKGTAVEQYQYIDSFVDAYIRLQSHSPILETPIHDLYNVPDHFKHANVE